MLDDAARGRAAASPRRRASSGHRSTTAPTAARAPWSPRSTADSPAADAGIEVGDVVVAVDDAATDGRAGVIAAIRDHEPGDEVEVVVVRDGEEQTFDVTLVERPTERLSPTRRAKRSLVAGRVRGHR